MSTPATPQPKRSAAGRIDWREHGLQVVSRLTSVLRMGRSYAVGNPVFTGQLAQLLGVIEPALAELGEVRVVECDGEVRFNDLRLPLRSTSTRFVDQLITELSLRDIGGIRLKRGLQVPELEAFMRLFLASETYKGAELERACLAAGIRHATPILEATRVVLTTGEGATLAPAHVEALGTWALAQSEALGVLGNAPASALRSRHCKRLVASLVDGILAGEPVVMALSDLDAAPPSADEHALRVALLALAVGARLGLKRDELATLGAAAIELAWSEGPLSEDESADDLEAVASVTRLLRRTPLDSVSLLAVQSLLGSTGGAEPLAGVLQLARAWVTLASLRLGDGMRWTPHEALGLVLGPLASRFHPAALAALVRVLGLYPPGQLVELDDGTVARVMAPGEADPARPQIERLTGPAGAGEPVTRGEVVDLPAERTIARAVPFVRPEPPAMVA